MQVNLRIAVFAFLLITKAPRIATDLYEDGSENHNQQFIVDQHKDTREFVKSELDTFLDSLVISFDQKLTAIEAKVEKSFAKLNESFQENRQNLANCELKNEILIANLSASDSFDQKLTVIESKMEKSIGNISNSFHQIREKQIASQLMNEKLISKLSDSINGSLSKVILELEHQIGIIGSNQQQTPCSETFNGTEGRIGSFFPSGEETLPDISTSAQPTPIQFRETIVEELVGDEGTIEFNGQSDFRLGRKLWIIAARGKQILESVSFEMKENSLGSSGRLTLWEVGQDRFVYTGLQTGWKQQVKFTYLSLLVVTFSMGQSSSVLTAPSFKLSFNVTRTPKDFEWSHVVMRKNGHWNVSFPPENNQDYPQDGGLQAVLAPPSGSPFRLTMTYLDIPFSHPNCAAAFKIWFLEESPTKAKFVEETEFGRCGRLGNISELIGHTTVAVVWFQAWSVYGVTGRGFRLDGDTST